jgi:hypothetical protein
MLQKKFSTRCRHWFFSSMLGISAGPLAERKAQVADSTKESNVMNKVVQDVNERGCLPATICPQNAESVQN